MAQIFPFCPQNAAHSDPRLPLHRKVGHLHFPTVPINIPASNVPGPGFLPCHEGREEVRREGDVVYSPRQWGHCINRSPPATVGASARSMPSCELGRREHSCSCLLPSGCNGRVGVAEFHAAAKPDYIRNTPRFVSTEKQISPRCRHPRVYLCFWGFAAPGYFI